MSGNATTNTDLSTNTDLAAIARSMVTTMRSTAPEVVSAPAPAQPATWPAFASALDALVSASPELKRAVEETMARSARQALAFGEGPLPSTEDFLASLRSPPIAGKGGTSIQGYWWGFQIKISHDDLNLFLATAVPYNTISAALASAIWHPAAPFIAAAAAFISGMLALLKSLDHGNGVYISMSWFAAGVFVPASA